MMRVTRRVLLVITAALSATLLLLVAARPSLVADPHPPEDLQGMAAWLAEHPADWRTAAAISDVALDSDLPRRFDVWRAAHALSVRLAPQRQSTAASYVRGGLFHWAELGPADRRDILDAAAPLLSDPTAFGRLVQPLWDLTRDFGYLRANAPRTISAATQLRDLAVANGLFAEYRNSREALRAERLRTFETSRYTLTPAELVNLLPDRIDTRDEPLVRRILDALALQPFTVNHVEGRVGPLLDYVLDRNLGPLTGLEAAVEGGPLSNATRARLALRLGNADAATRIEITTAVTADPEWVPYHLDRARFEARRRDRTAAGVYLTRAAAGGITDAVLGTMLDVARLTGDAAAAASAQSQLAARARQPPPWSGTCGKAEVCWSAWTDRWGSVSITASVVQSDAVAPYVEVYVDRVLAAEGAVDEPRTFAVGGDGLHRIEVRLVNPNTRGGVQRRIRLS
ncbi:MAG TPA: hypothetical protein VF824_00210 [Thermoanaerobaculia bacterium]|jgi:hypothetical protein